MTGSYYGHHLSFDVTAGTAAGIDAAISARIAGYLVDGPDEFDAEVEIDRVDVGPLTVGQDGTVVLWKAHVEVSLTVPFPEP